MLVAQTPKRAQNNATGRNRQQRAMVPNGTTCPIHLPGCFAGGVQSAQITPDAGPDGYLAYARHIPIAFSRAAMAPDLIQTTPKRAAACSAVLFDGSCPLCSREIAMYRDLAAPEAMQWVDISAPGYIAPAGTTQAALMRRFHAITPEGEMLSGARAFVHVWSQLPGWRHLASLSKVPGVLVAMELSYRGFLVFRPWMQRTYRRWSA